MIEYVRRVGRVLWKGDEGQLEDLQWVWMGVFEAADSEYPIGRARRSVEGGVGVGAGVNSTDTEAGRTAPGYLETRSEGKSERRSRGGAAPLLGGVGSEGHANSTETDLTRAVAGASESPGGGGVGGGGGGGFAAVPGGFMAGGRSTLRGGRGAAELRCGAERRAGRSRKSGGGAAPPPSFRSRKGPPPPSNSAETDLTWAVAGASESPGGGGVGGGGGGGFEAVPGGFVAGGRSTLRGGRAEAELRCGAERGAGGVGKAEAEFLYQGLVLDGQGR